MDDKLIPVRVTIRRGDPRRGESSMKYPKGLDPKVIDQLGIGMHYGKTKQIGKGDNEEFSIIVIPLWHLREVLAQGDGEFITVFDEDEAEQFFTDHVPEPEEVISDRQEVEVIEKKVALGVELTPRQVKAIEPSDPTPGLVVNPLKGFKNKVSSDSCCTKAEITALKAKIVKGEKL